MVEFVLWVSKDCSVWLLSWHSSDIHWLGLGTYWRKACVRLDWVSDRWRRTETDRDRKREAEKNWETKRKGAAARPALHTSVNISTSIPDRMRNTVSWPWLIKQGRKQHGHNPPHAQSPKSHRYIREWRRNKRTFVFLTCVHLNLIIEPTDSLQTLNGKQMSSLTFWEIRYLFYCQELRCG